MKIQIFVSTDDEVGEMTDEERAGLQGLRAFAAEGLDLPAELLNTSEMGWHGAAAKAGARIFDRLIKRNLTDALSVIVAPWVPPGQAWPGHQDGGYFHTSWKLFARRNPA